MKKNLMRLCCLVLALVMALSMAACGKSGDASEAAPSGSAKKPAATAAPEFVYAAEFKPLMEKSKDWMSVREYNEDGMYFTKYEKVGERPHEGETPTYEGEFDIYSSFLYFMDASGKVTKLDSYTSLPPKEDDQGRRDYVSTADLNGICFTDDGFVTIEYVATSWVEGDAKKNSEEYWQDQKYTQDYYIRWFDKQGNELSCAPVDVPADTWLRGYNMQLDSKGNVVVANDQGLRAIAPDGTDAYTIQTDGWIDNLISMPDGCIGVSIYGEQMMLCFLDDEAGKLKDGVELNFDLYNAVPGDSNYDFYFSNGSNFYDISRGYASTRSASYTLRVPSERFQELMGTLSEIGNVPYTHVYTENVSAQYYDTQARMEAYKAQEARLLEMMDRAESVDDLISIESRLSDLRYEIESLQTSLNHWDRRVAYSSVYLELQEVREYTQDTPVQLGFGERLGRAFRSGIHGFVAFCQDAILWLAESLPALVLIALVLVVLLAVRKNRKKKKAAVKAAKQD